MSHFFIDRPIFAWVIAILMMLAGILTIPSLPRTQYPEIAPPQVTVSASYPGASAGTVEDAVTQLIEQQMTGVDNLNYIYSTSDAAGRSSVNMVFKHGTDADVAQMQVQNKLQMAMAMLPDTVQRNGLTVQKTSANFFLVIAFTSEDGSMTSQDLSDYTSSFIIDPLRRLDGVGDTQLFGAPYAMRVWLDPNMLTKFRMNPSDVISAIQSQNLEVPAGKIGNVPAVPGQTTSFSVIAQSSLKLPEEFENIIIRTNEDGSLVRIKDIARVELEGESFMAFARLNGKPASGLGLKLASGANALATAERVKEKLAELETFFPPGMAWTEGYDTTPFIEISLKEVVKTLIEAIILVFILMYLFLQDIRATVIPTIAVPVVLLGTFGVMSIAGFTINTLTMFGMVLAIGLLVDDAIIVVENVERVMSEEGLSPRDAARKSMTQITGALVGIGLVLSAVFLPMAFFGGAVGVIYRQFSITIISAMILSVIVALVLTPALCASMMKPHVHDGAQNKARPQLGFFGWFNRMVVSFTNHYTNTVDNILRKKPLTAFMFLVYLVIIGGVGLMFVKLPTAFLPDEDQGVLMFQVTLPEGASFERTTETMKHVEQYFIHTPTKQWSENPDNANKTYNHMEDPDNPVERIMAVTGFSMSGLAPNVGMGFLKLKDWSLRNTPEMRAGPVAHKAVMAMYNLGDARVITFQPPAILELGVASGFDLQLMNNAGLTHEQLTQAKNMLLNAVYSNPENQAVVTNVRHQGMEDTTHYKIDIDMDKATAQGLNPGEVATTISAMWGGAYVNNFIASNKAKKVMVQVDAPFRMHQDDFRLIHIRNNKGEMVPFSSFASGRWMKQSPRLERYNGVPSMEIVGQAQPGHSSGEAMNLMEKLVAELPMPGIGMSWTALSFQEKLSGQQAPALYTISLLVVFLCLAALYESWSIPFSVMLVVPLGVLGALAGAYLRNMNNDVYFQVGLLTIVGLSAKNAILIVEFAKDLEEKGMDLVSATVEACRLRLRPIIMTSLAFMLGVTPLAISSGAGSGGQNAIGTGVLSGMTTSTVLGIYFIPLFFVLVSRIFHVKVKQHGETSSQAVTQGS